MPTSRAPKRADVPSLRFEGHPGALEAFVPVAPERRRSIAVAVDLPAEVGVLRPQVLTAPAGDRTLVRLLVPRGTPPGDYAAQVRAGDTTMAAVAVVLAHVHLRATPHRLQLSARGGTTTTASLSVLNDGNVVCHVPRTLAFGLFEADGLERAIGVGLYQDGDARARADRMFSSLAASHGGLVRVSVTEGAGDLSPGELRRLVLALHLGEALKPGRTYTGTLPLGDLQLAVSLSVEGARQAAPGTDDGPKEAQ
jgi:hypothetical protein